ncbi:N-acetylneuraminate synthase [Akkermansiaceae bacterium]|nr:N-acetylneuraminate synthase [Akkermansiaceae bacterium]
MTKVIIIAEAGVNHNGSLERAIALVEAAAAAGADAVKFQTFKAKNVVTPDAAKANYQLDIAGEAQSQYQMLEDLELLPDDFSQLVACCDANDIEFLSTPFDLPSVDLLEELKMDKWKLPSGEITNLPYLRKIGALGCDVILSTGMSDLDEISQALSALEAAGTERTSITVLHCNTEYPTPMCDVNLRAMKAIREAFPGLKGVGFSDHTLGIEVPVAACAMGATVIEKHFTLDRSLPGPDHRASLEPEQLKAMVAAIRHVEEALGNGIKKPTPSEIKNLPIVRKSIVAATSIAEGEVFSNENLTIKRPGTGVSPMQWDRYVGKAATRAYEPNELIDA